jgi:REP element-mobilizing transposase RayT
MANKFAQVLLHIIFSIGSYRTYIPESSREKLEKYITGTVHNLNHRMMAIYCNPDHIHMLISFNPDGSISDLVRTIKNSSVEFIKVEQLVNGRFNWQKGYGVFSVSQRHLSIVAGYIERQPIHHKKKRYKDEFVKFLKDRDITFDDRYLFDI